jgi:hypothetical protein
MQEEHLTSPRKVMMPSSLRTNKMILIATIIALACLLNAKFIVGLGMGKVPPN